MRQLAADALRRHIQALERAFGRMERAWSRVALALVLVAFGLYVSGALPAHVPLNRLPAVLGAGAPGQVAGGTSGLWAWLALVGHGDMLALAALALLGLTIVCAYLALVPVLWRQRDWLYLALVAVQLVLFGLALLGVGVG